MSGDWSIFYDAQPDLGDLIVVRDISPLTSLEVCRNLEWVHRNVGWSSINISNATTFIFLDSIIVDPPINALGKTLWRVLHGGTVLYLKCPYKWKRVNLPL